MAIMLRLMCVCAGLHWCLVQDGEPQSSGGELLVACPPGVFNRCLPQVRGAGPSLAPRSLPIRLFLCYFLLLVRGRSRKARLRGDTCCGSLVVRVGGARVPAMLMRTETETGTEAGAGAVARAAIVAATVVVVVAGSRAGTMAGTMTGAGEMVRAAMNAAPLCRLLLTSISWRGSRTRLGKPQRWLLMPLICGSGWWP
jgi:hypothetical protein